ncbi:uncharacterized protein N0V89_005653 [Didymosphaeria variabile]|uniref:MFS general substrate transporter n=1 Tax=Didymosphaeria variabile TaxID=1932322 RepID=A0A9W8XL55_9PLEO|nr:uncharacterized protein N0V89_005653 [Didymosphaeria variabile]KAJ4353922.1 hypothetical protein N0V89_005653 [Didymosphaeria variabile]
MQPVSVPQDDDSSAWPPGTVTLEVFEVDELLARISAITPTWAPMNIELGFSYETLQNSYATGTAALGVGALLFIPFALKYGRRPIYILSSLGQVAVAIWAAKMTSTADLYLIQVFNCLFGSLAEVIVQMTIADVFFVHQRGLMNNLYICTMTIGTSMSALVSGYITVGQGWRWVWWWTAICMGTCLTLFAFFYEETKFVPPIDGFTGAPHPSVHSANKATMNPDVKPGDDQLKPIESIVTVIIPPRKTYIQRLKPWYTTSGGFRKLAHHSYQPLLVQCTIPAVLYVALLYGLVTAALQVSVTLVATYMPAPPYNFNAAAVGLMSLPPLIGNVIGTALSAPFSDRIILYLARRSKGVYEPEMRLWLLLVFAPVFPAALLLTGYALDKGMSWPVVAVGLGLLGFAMPPIASVALTYLTDAYTDVSIFHNLPLSVH